MINFDKYKNSLVRVVYGSGHATGTLEEITEDTVILRNRYDMLQEVKQDAITAIFQQQENANLPLYEQLIGKPISANYNVTGKVGYYNGVLLRADNEWITMENSAGMIIMVKAVYLVTLAERGG